MRRGQIPVAGDLSRKTLAAHNTCLAMEAIRRMARRQRPRCALGHSTNRGSQSILGDIFDRVLHTEGGELSLVNAENLTIAKQRIKQTQGQQNLDIIIADFNLSCKSLKRLTFASERKGVSSSPVSPSG